VKKPRRAVTRACLSSVIDSSLELKKMHCPVQPDHSILADLILARRTCLRKP
jgi:hypothetical protein